MNMKKSVSGLVVAGAALLGFLTVPLSVAAFTPASQACKDCVDNA